MEMRGERSICTTIIREGFWEEAALSGDLKNGLDYSLTPLSMQKVEVSLHCNAKAMGVSVNYCCVTNNNHLLLPTHLPAADLGWS